MNYIFFGTPRFAAIILEKLIGAGFIPVAVICNSDKPTGRKQMITPPPTKLLAQKYNIQILQPEVLSNSKFHAYRQAGEIPCLPAGRRNSKFDLFVVAAYGKIIPKEILDMPRLGTIGVHPSLLPKYRGPTPIQTAILNGEKETGVTLFMVDEKVDHGQIITSNEYRVMSNENYEILEIKLAELGAELLVEFLRKINQCLGSPTSKKLTKNVREVGLPDIGVELRPQSETEATYTKKFTTQDGYVDLEKDNPILIERKIRALNPEPGVWTMRETSDTANNGQRTNDSGQRTDDSGQRTDDMQPPQSGARQGTRTNEVSKLSEISKLRNKRQGTRNKRVKLLEAEIVDGKLKLKKIQVEGKRPTEN